MLNTGPLNTGKTEYLFLVQQVTAHEHHTQYTGTETWTGLGAQGEAGPVCS